MVLSHLVLVIVGGRNPSGIPRADVPATDPHWDILGTVVICFVLLKYGFAFRRPRGVAFDRLIYGRWDLKKSFTHDDFFRVFKFRQRYEIPGP